MILVENMVETTLEKVLTYALIIFCIIAGLVGIINFNRQIQREEMFLAVMNGFGGVALILATIGVIFLRYRQGT